MCKQSNTTPKPYLRTLLVGMVMMVSLGSMAQSRHLSFGGGLMPGALRDQAFSPLKYSGTGFEVFLGYRSKNKRKETIWLLSGGEANFRSAFGRHLKTIAIRLTNYNLYARSDEHAGFQFGWANNNAFYNRLIDDFQNFNGRVDYFTSFGPAARYSKSFSLWQQSFTFQTAAHTQLIGFYIPSGYVASLPTGYGYEPNGFAAGLFNSIQIFHPGSSFNAGLWPQLDWQLRSGNSISLNYLYEFTYFSRSHRSQRSTGSWFITFNMAL